MMTALPVLSCGRTSVLKEEHSAEHVDNVPSRESAVSRAGGLVIVPSSPTADTDIVAVYKGDSSGGVVYRWERNGAVIEGVSGERLARGSFSKKDEIRVTVRSGPFSATRTVEVRNTPPAITAVRLVPENFRRGMDITAEPEAADPDGDDARFEYQWIINGEDAPEETSPVLKGDRFRAGDRVSLRVVPNDGYDRGTPFTTPTVTVPNAPPRFVSIPPAEFSSRTYLYKASAIDPDGGPVSFSLATAPEGMKIGPDGTIEWAIGEGVAGTFGVSVVAHDSSGGSSAQDFNISVKEAVPERGP